MPLPTSDKLVSFAVWNRTGHNGNASLNCGGEAEAVEFTFVTPAEKFIQRISGDTQELVGLVIEEGQLLTVVVKDPVTQDELVSKSAIYSPSLNPVPAGGFPLIRLCPKDHLDFKYF